MTRRMTIKMHETKTDYDLIIIGAGIYGIQAARTYLELYPTDDIVVLEASKCVGGVWSSDRMYDDFWTQNPLGFLEFSDQPLHDIPSTDQYHGFFAAKHITRYLNDYVDSHAYDGKSLRQRVCFDSSVEHVEKQDGLWSVQTENDEDPIIAPKLIDASGITSVPQIPDLPGMADFRGSMYHHKDFARSNITGNGLKERIVVVGGAKSAADVAYAAAKAEKQVTWVIRRSGSGPAAYAGVKGPGPYRNSNESLFTRFTSRILASIFMEESWLTSLLYNTAVGQMLFRRIWKNINQQALDLANYSREDGKSNGFYNLQPDTDLFWSNESPGTNNHADFFDVIATKVKVIREDIARFVQSGVSLANGTELGADTIVFATGWKVTQPYYSARLATTMGLPVEESDWDLVNEQSWQKLEQQAECEILGQFPILKDPPIYHKTASSTTPFRLYNGIVPTDDRSIVFLGKMMLGNHFRNAEVQALHATALLDETLSLPPVPIMKNRIAKVVAWCRRRYLSKGQLGAWFYFDMVPYTDMLLRDLGLSSHRKTGWKDLFEPCFAKDLKGLIEEYKSKHNLTLDVEKPGLVEAS